MRRVVQDQRISFAVLLHNQNLRGAVAAHIVFQTHAATIRLRKWLLPGLGQADLRHSCQTHNCDHRRLGSADTVDRNDRRLETDR